MAAPEEHELTDVKGKQQSADSDAGDFDPDDYHHANQYLSLKTHWGLPRFWEQLLFYCFALLGWICLIAAAAIASYRSTSSRAFIGTITAGMFFHWAAWFQTAVAMVQRASYTREEVVVERVQFLFYAIRLQRLMLPAAVICFVTFLQAYARRKDTHDLAYWLIFLLMFILNTVFSVMNAYNNITWEADRLYYDEGIDGIPKVFVAILGI